MAPAVIIFLEANDDLTDEHYPPDDKQSHDKPGDDVDQEFQQEIHNQREFGRLNNTQYNRNNCMAAGTRGRLGKHAELWRS